MEVIKEAANDVEALRAVVDHSPDLLFLDVQMPRIDGFDLVEILGVNCPLIILVTTFDHYTLLALKTMLLIIYLSQ